jgi:hypothetical protein
MSQWRGSFTGERQYLATDGYWYAAHKPALAPSNAPAAVSVPPAVRPADGFNTFGRVLFGGRVRSKVSDAVLFAIGVALVAWLIV